MVKKHTEGIVRKERRRLEYRGNSKSLSKEEEYRGNSKRLSKEDVLTSHTSLNNLLTDSA